MEILILIVILIVIICPGMDYDYDYDYEACTQGVSPGGFLTFTRRIEYVNVNEYVYETENG